MADPDCVCRNAFVVVFRRQVVNAVRVNERFPAVAVADLTIAKASVWDVEGSEDAARPVEYHAVSR